MLAKFKEYHVCIQTFSFHLAYFTLLEDLIFDEFLPRSMSFRALQASRVRCGDATTFLRLFLFAAFFTLLAATKPAKLMNSIAGAKASLAEWNRRAWQQVLYSSSVA